LIQEFFKENYLNQVFTHPYTPQENGHIKSFHAILAKKLRLLIWSIDELEEVLTLFYEK
jgi:transposase InsO family protein